MSPRRATLALLLVAGCSSGPSDNGGVARVVIDGTATLSLVVSDTRQLTARAEATDGSPIAGAALVWSSTAAGVAAVSPAGLVTAVAPGEARIIARSGERADTVAVTVTASGVANVIVTLPRSLLKVSDTVRAVAKAVDANGAEVTGRPVTWSTSNPDAAVITPFGLVLGLAPANPVSISATVDGRTGSATIAIIPAEITSVVVSPDTAIIAPGGTFQFQVAATDEFGFDVIDPETTWSSFLPNIATVDQTGKVTALALGETTITATVAGTQGQALVRVLQVETDKYRIEVTNYLIYPIEVLENGVSVGQVGPQNTGVISRPLRASFQFGWAVVRPQNRGEPVAEVMAPIANPTGTIHFDVDNVLDDGRVFFTPVLRNLTLAKPFVDFLPKVDAVPCQCSLSPELDEVRNFGYWLLNQASAARFFAPNDPALNNPLRTVPVPPAAPEARSGIWRHTLTSLP